MREGASVVATDVIDDAPAYPAGAGTVAYHRLDVSRPEDWDTLVEVVRETHGVVHGLVNNAGITHRARLGDVTLDDLNRVLAVNVTGALLGIQALTPLMPPGSSIVNVGSVAALTAHYAVATASKWAPRGLSAGGMELGRLGIRVNSIHPGYIETQMTASAPAAFREASLAVAPLGAPRNAHRRRVARRLPAVGRVVVPERRGDRDRRRSVGAWRCEGTVGRPPRGGGGRDDETVQVERRRTARD